MERIDEMDVGGGEAKDFDVVIALDVEPNGIEIRQGLAFFIFFPIVGVAAEKDIGAGRVIGDVEGAEDGHFFFGRMRGENGDLVEEAFEARYWGGERERYWVGRSRLHADFAITAGRRVC